MAFLQYLLTLRSVSDDAIDDKFLQIDGWHLMVLGVRKGQYGRGVRTALVKSKMTEVRVVTIVLHAYV